MSNKTLIVGGAGFLGNALSMGLVQEGIAVVIADSRRRLENYAIKQPSAEYIEADWPNLPDLGKLSQIDNVIHLSWSTNPSSSMSDIVDDAENNIIGTLRLLEQCRNIAPQKFIFMSSGGTIYGNNSHPLISEHCATNPISAYGISKLSCENYVKLYSLRQRFKPLIVRLGNPYGSYQLQGTPTGVIANFIRKIDQNQPLEIYGDGETVRDYIHIDDVTACIKKMIHSPAASGLYNLGSGVGISVQKVIELIKSRSNKDVDIIYHESRRNDVRSVVLDIRKLNQELDFNPRTSISEGIDNMIQSINHQGALGFSKS